VECLHVIYRGAPDEVKILLRKSPVDMSDLRIVSYLTHLRLGKLPSFEKGIKARGWVHGRHALVGVFTTALDICAPLA
jgi:hypothetical protein